MTATDPFSAFRLADVQWSLRTATADVAFVKLWFEILNVERRFWTYTFCFVSAISSPAGKWIVTAAGRLPRPGWSRRVWSRPKAVWCVFFLLKSVLPRPPAPPPGGPPAMSKEIVDRRRFHHLHHSARLDSSSSLDRLEIVEGGGIGAGLNHVRHFLHLVEVAVGPGARLIVHVPIECFCQQQ